MKAVEISVNDLADTTHSWIPIEVPDCFLQIARAEWNVLPNAANENYAFGISKTERVTGAIPTTVSGGLLFLRKKTFAIVTDGGGEIDNKIEEKLYNEETETCRMYIYLYHNLGGTSDVKITLFYTETKLQEVVS